MENKLGKIRKIGFGYGGYQDAMFGLSLEFSFGSGRVADFKGSWGVDMKPSEHAEWDEAVRSRIFDETMRFINQMLIEAKKRDISELVNVPVEVTFEGNVLKSWRILTEVI